MSSLWAVRSAGQNRWNDVLRVFFSRQSCQHEFVLCCCGEVHITSLMQIIKFDWRVDSGYSRSCSPGLGIRSNWQKAQFKKEKKRKKTLRGNSLTVVTGLCLKKTPEKPAQFDSRAAVMSLATWVWIDKAALELWHIPATGAATKGVRKQIGAGEHVGVSFDR